MKWKTPKLEIEEMEEEKVITELSVWPPEEEEEGEWNEWW